MADTETGGIVTKVFLIFSVSILLLTNLHSASGTQSDAVTIAGRWQIEFTLFTEPHRIQFDAQASGEGTFLVLDQRSNLAAPATPTQARWSLMGQSPAIYYFVISGEVAFKMSDGRMETGRLELSASSDLTLPVTSLRGWGIFYSSTAADDARGRQDPQFSFVGARANIPTVRVLLPGAGERLRRGKEATIEWEVQTISPLASQRLLISLDGGESFVVLAPSLPGDARSFVWTVPGDLEKTKRALIKIVATDANGASVEAISEQMFRIK